MAGPYPTDINTVFDAASEFTSKYKEMKATTTQQLQFYGLFKQATKGKCNTSQPSMFNAVARAKWGAWNDMGNMSKDEAKRKYVEGLTNQKPDWREWDGLKAFWAARRPPAAAATPPVANGAHASSNGTHKPVANGTHTSTGGAKPSKAPAPKEEPAPTSLGVGESKADAVEPPSTPPRVVSGAGSGSGAAAGAAAAAAVLTSPSAAATSATQRLDQSSAGLTTGSTELAALVAADAQKISDLEAGLSDIMSMTGSLASARGAGATASDATGAPEELDVALVQQQLKDQQRRLAETQASLSSRVSKLEKKGVLDWIMSFVTSFKWARTLRGPRAFAMGIVLVAFALFMWRRGGR